MLSTQESIYPKENQNTVANQHVLAKRIVFTMGGKGGVGKTGVTLAIADWYNSHQIPFTPLDLDYENKTLGSLKHYFPDAAKVTIHTDAGLDVFLTPAAQGETDILLADMGGGAGEVARQWFQFMRDDFNAIGIAFTAIGVITPDAASVESVLTWAANLQTAVDYLIIENATTANPDFTYWRHSNEAQAFRSKFNPLILSMEYRLPELERLARQRGLTLRCIGANDSSIAHELQISHRIRAKRYFARFAQQLDTAQHVLLPVTSQTHTA